MNSLQAPEWLPHVLVPFVTLSYPVTAPVDPDSFPNSAYYETGPLDVCLVITFIAVMAILRDASRLGLMEPFAKWKLTRDLEKSTQKKSNGKPLAAANGNGNGHRNGHAAHANGSSGPSPKEYRKLHRKVLRFAEQGWSVIYYTVTWSVGLYIHLNLPTAIFAPSAVWENYPHIPLATPVKFYYLVQVAFYLHQVLILNAEARRKDHVQMMSHHVITIALIGASYFTHFTRIGCLILVIIDWCDIWLPLAKMLRYIDLSTLCDITFVFFLVSWFVTRHIAFIFAIISTFIDCPRLIPFEWAPESNRYLSKPAWIVFCTLLSALQVLQVFWFLMICRITWRVVSGQGANDERSEDEDGDDQNDKKDQ